MRFATVLAVLTATLVAAPSAQAARAPKLPGLEVRGAGFYQRLSLPLEARDYAVAPQRRKDRVTLKWPAVKPCATTTLRLVITPGQTDPLARVRAAVPDADREVAVSGLTAPATPFAPFGAARRASTIRDNSYLSAHGIAARRLSSHYGDPQNALVELHVVARMTRTGGRCGGTSFFSVGPALRALTLFVA